MLLPLLLLVLGLLGGVVDAQPEYRVPAHTTPFWDQLFFDTEFPPLLRCGSKLPLCAWAGKLAPSDLTQVAPEPNSISQGTVLLMHGPDDTTEYRIRGEYPRVRFFSFQTYDYPGVQPVGHIADFEIEPCEGSVNPFNDFSRGPLDTGRYEVYVTARGNKGYPNEIPAYPPRDHDKHPHAGHGQLLARALNGTSDFFVLAMRLYGRDPTADFSVPYGTGASLWGFVPPPTLERKAAGSDEWVPLRQCDVKEQQCTIDFVSKWFAQSQFYIPFRQAPGLFCPIARPREPTDSFYLYGTNQTDLQDVWTGFKNSYLTYLYYCDSSHKFKRGSNSLVLRIKGRLPITPMGLWNDTKIANWPLYDVRYFSFHAVDFASPMPSYSSICDSDMWFHYGPQWDRWYSVVAARSADTARRCGLLHDEDGPDMFLPWARADRKLEHHNLDMPGVISRSLLPKVYRAGPAHHGTSPTDVRIRCQNPDGSRSQQCSEAAFYREVMGEQYPRLEVYDCDVKTGEAKRLV